VKLSMFAIASALQWAARGGGVREAAGGDEKVRLITWAPPPPASVADSTVSGTSSRARADLLLVVTRVRQRKPRGAVWV